MAVSPGESAAKVALVFVAMAAFNAYRRGEAGPWFRAKFFNATGGGAPQGVTTFDVFTGGGTAATTAPAAAAVGGAVGGAIGTTGPIIPVTGITGGLSTGFAARWTVMASAAAAAGVVLTGGGYRSTARQIELRKAHGCGDSNIYNSGCKGNPPTAVPGRSRHETGDAVDVKLTGAGGRQSPEYRWLAANAARFGIFNLPSEPWHWSKDGK